MLPLYVRSTLLEKNGTKIGGDGDQPVEIMNMDRRYSHYIGRSLNRFEPGKRYLITYLLTHLLTYSLTYLRTHSLT